MNPHPLRIHGTNLQDPAIPIGTVIIDSEGKAFQKIAEHRNLHGYQAVWGSPVLHPLGGPMEPLESEIYTIIHIEGVTPEELPEILTIPWQELGQEGEEES